MKKKNKSSASPKPRGVWKINPKTRVKPSGKAYHRSKQKRELRKGEVDWFGTGFK